MKISGFRTKWIIILSVLSTVDTALRAITKGIFNKEPDRAWVDKTIQKWIDHVLSLAGITCKVVNPYNVQPEAGKATIVMCNHSSIYDIPLGFKIFPDQSIRMLAKKELSRIPLLGSAMRITEFPFIDRKNRKRAFEDLAYARKLMESGIIMWIAPEGTRSLDGKLKPFKKGAFISAIEANATIIPVGIHGAFEILPARTYQFNLNQKAEIHIGKPIDASAFTLENKDELVAKVYAAISELLS
jgi:1-acyl-sn-glycerol-3-phosphate acyltransferase